MGVAGSFVGGGMGGAPVVPPLDCSGKGTALETGPHRTVESTSSSPTAIRKPSSILVERSTRIANAMNLRFMPKGEPYGRYRKFVNICVIRLPSSPICGSSVHGCCGNDGTRLANCNTTAVNNTISQNLPASFEVDWRAVVLNGSSWWNSGGALMLWSGGNQDGPAAALHEAATASIPSPTVRRL